MKNRYEIVNLLLKCLNPIFFAKVFTFFIIKIMDLRKRSYKPFKFYPPLVKKIYFDYNIQKSNGLNANIEKYSINKCELILCSNKFLFKDESDWRIEFEDQDILLLYIGGIGY